MILAFSTSSPRIGLALFSETGECCGSREFDGEGAVNRTFLELDDLLAAHGVPLSQVRGFIADVGPGSFAGVKAGVTFAKVLGQACGRLVAGVSSFDLIARDRPVAIPSRRGQYFVRHPSGEIEITDQVPAEAVGYGTAFSTPEYPMASKASDWALATRLRERSAPWGEPAQLVAEYRLEPSITPPKKPYPAERA
ncbi:MAG TPA: tRNA (adenosine(37)-N6)-threonylcarbamoyltransferase complex dimerization subunit type 1 TsaB [Fimbriimonadaceae bacterium]|nr:tRNA (adenosine(37)-N6)-threonylcarbamoyltransferase complex dimerization subunit type 1 TsaB [Fimbriimonadaceae bacterium]